MSVMNFQQPVVQLRKALQVALPILLSLSVLVLVLLVVELAQLNVQRGELERQIKEQSLAMPSDAVSVSDLVTLHHQARELNALIAQKGRAVESVLHAVQEALLVNVRLDRFEYDATQGAATMEAVSPSTVNLADFVDNLEAMPVVDQVVVVRQQKDEGSEGLNRYEILVTAEAH